MTQLKSNKIWFRKSKHFKNCQIFVRIENISITGITENEKMWIIMVSLKINERELL